MPSVWTKVVYVDSDPAVTRIALAHLEGAGFKVTTARDYTGALRAVRSDPPDLVLVDSKMAGGSERFVAQLRKTPGLRDIAVAILSVKPELRDKISAVRAGANYYLDKSVQPEEMTMRIRRIMGDKLAGGDPSELRILPRLTMTFPVVVKRLRAGRDSKPVKGQIRDLSGAGISFQSPDNFDKNETVELQFQPRDSKAIRVFMEVVWRRISGDGYLIGCKYLQTYPGDLEAVAEFVDRKKR